MNNEFYDLDPNEENASRTSSNSCDTDRLSIGIDYSPYKALGESIKESKYRIPDQTNYYEYYSNQLLPRDNNCMAGNSQQSKQCYKLYQL